MADADFTQICNEAMQSPDAATRVNARLLRDVVPVMESVLQEGGLAASEFMSVMVRMLAIQAVMFARFAKPGHEVELIEELLGEVSKDAVGLLTETEAPQARGARGEAGQSGADA